MLEEPIRSEIFSLARLEVHAESLAKAQTVMLKRKRFEPIAARIAENHQILEDSYAQVIYAVQNQQAITPAAEWLIDNFHIVRALIKEIQDFLPPQFYRELPKLADGPLKGYPRIYGIAWAFVAHTDSRFDPNTLKQFLLAYQKVEPLTIGELWAISITIRIILVENSRRLAAKIVESQKARQKANLLANEILGLGDRVPRTIKKILAELENVDFSQSFAVQLIQRLRFQEVAADPILEWIEKRLRADHLNADTLVSNEQSSQTAANATMRNIITSARLISILDWQIFFESVSQVHEILSEHHGYRNMDFTSRDRYRHGLEELSRQSDLSENEVAREVIFLTREAEKNRATQKELDPIHFDRLCDPGYYLISSGRRIFETKIKFRATFRGWLTGILVQYNTFIYLSLIMGGTFALLAWALNFGDVPLDFKMLLLAICGFFPASDIALVLVNRFIIGIIGPKYLPRLSLKDGIPENLKTFVVVPTLFAPIEKLDEQVEQLEAHYLSNPNKNIYFALLTDWVDSDIELSNEDQNIFQLALKKIANLNQKYSLNPNETKGEDRFYLFHRKRIYNKQEGKWMGWERKRGKLHEFNRLVLGHRDTSHLFDKDFPLKLPEGIRYIVTLDADTKLPLGSVLQLVGTLAHPLNRACFDPLKKRITEGYGILQPRVTAALPTREDFTVFQRITAEQSGVDPYVSAVSDVFQDLFGEGSFTGKGIYDIEAFENAMANRVPENTLLSHDLFEGNFARCGFLSDCEFYEEFPSHTEVASLRSHRWTRGDWQLLPWILGRGGWRSMPLISRWKMLENLRRSLAIPMTLLTLLLPLLPLNFAFDRWWLLAFGSLGVSTILTFVTQIFPKPAAIEWGQHLFFCFKDFIFSAVRSLFFLALLPHQAWVNCDAIARSLYRLLVSHQNLLEWTTAAHAKARASLNQKSFWLAMAGGLSIVGVGILAISYFNPQHLLLCLPLFLLWLASPKIAHYCSVPPRHAFVPIRIENVEFLRMAARRTWQFFATFVTAEDRHLPPDNYQEDPTPVIAHRSSPTNFGLYLLSTLAAHDFGWIGLLELSDRLESTLKSLDQLPKHHGHFFNWYETTEGRCLEPKYISSVDNGNLAGHLLAVAQGCIEKCNERVIQFLQKHGSENTIAIMELILKKIAQKKPTLNFEAREVREACAELKYQVLKRAAIAIQNEKSQLLLEAAKKLAGDHPSELECREILSWCLAIDKEINSHARDFLGLIPWAEYVELMLPEGFTLQDRLAWEKIKITLAQPVALRELPLHCEKLARNVKEFSQTAGTGVSQAALAFVPQLLKALEQSSTVAQQLEQKLIASRQLCLRLFNQMNFATLYDPVRRLFSIGMRASDNVLDESYYDLLASEARLTSFIAVAKGDVPVAHWFSLGRTLTPVEGNTALVSWSGSMFEYLMPCLVMHTPHGSLLEQTCELIVQRQKSYGKSKGVAWGVSESAYNKRDLHLTYQYSNFGIPDLGLKHGLGADLVIAPYASFLAAMFGSNDAADNLRELEKDGACGHYGFYEAVDYSKSRLPEDENFAIIKAYMAHHQGMSLVALANVFKGGIMRKRFHAEPLVHATELILQERVPRHVRTIKPNLESVPISIVREVNEQIARHYTKVDFPYPTTGLLSNSNYTVMLTAAGSGFSRFRDIALTRWREDATTDQWGSYFYLKDLASHKVWSATYHPTRILGQSYEVDFAEDRAQFSRKDEGIGCQLEVIVSPEVNAETRKLTLTNLSESPRQIEITSYSEIVINSQSADIAHPAFSSLFVQTEYVPELNALIAKRRPRSNHEKPHWIAQVLFLSEHSFGITEYETDRGQFIGRGRTTQNPRALYGESSHKKMANTVGPVLDPIFSLRTKVWLEAGVTTSVTYSTLVAENREALLLLAEKFQDRFTYERISSIAWTQAHVKLSHLNIETAEAHQFQRLATRLIFSDSSLRPSSEILKRNKKNVTGLWSYGISGDFPIVLLRIDDAEDRGMVRQLLKVQEYLATKQFVVDLIILNEKAVSYAQELQNLLEAMVHSSTVVMRSSLPQSRGKVFILRTDILPKVDLDLLYSEARVVLSSRLGSLTEQIFRLRSASPKSKLIESHATDENTQPTRFTAATEAFLQNTIPPAPTFALEFFNGIGGFTKDGREYVVILNKDKQTPAPWINIIAQEDFGFQVSESGAGYTWAMNSRENQLTPWSNDPICDSSGEAFYILDRENGNLWSPTALPIRIKETTYVASHGQGYSRFEHSYLGIQSELTQFIMPNHPVKISRWTLHNSTSKTRKLSVTGYVEWVLGFSRSTMAPTTITEKDEKSGLILASNARSIEYGTMLAFTGFILLEPLSSEEQLTFTGDRCEFLGRNGNLQNPAGVLLENGFSGLVGARLDPCGAQQIEFELESGAKKEFIFVLGQAKDREHIHELVLKIKAEGPQKILTQAITNWDNILEKIQVETPDRAFDFMLNRWLLYQTLACRIWARSAFYQAGGAFGFRDQLQDVMALMYSQPQLARQQILRASHRQFIEGDVQHWWHPPTGRGVRTHFSDDLLWLPYVAFQYLKITEDSGILNEEISFIEGPLLRPDQEDFYFTPTTSPTGASLYEHCAMTLDRSLQTGIHGLPLIGGGDWNDGMNRVGSEGKGESVWLAWFLYTNLKQFAPIAERRGQEDRALRWRDHALQLLNAIEQQAWDGEWYRRAFYDDGNVLGSIANDECKIDSLAQTWSVISAAGKPERQIQAMASLEKHLLREQDKVLLLFTPPFDKTPRDPGYIKGYLPGVRENGGQYTHAAAWSVIALAMLGDGRGATELFAMLNPINHALNTNALEKYKIEPYVLAGDIYAEPPHIGRGGWSWYTGAAGWMYRAGLENILGLSVKGNRLSLKPVIHPDWPSFKIRYVYGNSIYKIEVLQVAEQTMEMNSEIILVDDGKTHEVKIFISNGQIY